MRVRRIIGSGLAAVLVAAVGLIMVGTRHPRERIFTGTLKDLLPQAAEVPGWTVDYRPVAETAEMKRAVGEILNHDDAIHAIYTRGERRITIYVAYWAPGKMSPRLIAGHTPDVCWVAAGWVSQEAKKADLRVERGTGQKVERRELSIEGKKFGGEYSAGGASTLAMESRVFRSGEKTEHVVFCHMVGGRPLSLGAGRVSPWYEFLADLVARGLQQREEQFFLRISSNRPLAEFQDEEPVKILLSRFREAVTRKTRE